MTKAERYPELWAIFTKLQARREEIYTRQAPLREKQEALRRQQEALRAEEMKLVDQIRADRPELGEIDAQLSGLARAMGGQALNS